MKESPSSTNRISNIEQTPDLRLIPNPFDSPSSGHLKQRLTNFHIFYEAEGKSSTNEILSIERRAQINPYPLPENVVQIDALIFDENLRNRYQRAADHFCQTDLDLPTPIVPIQQHTRLKQSSWSSSSSNSSLDRTRTTRNMACQTRLSLPPAADLDSLIQSFASNTSDPDELVPVITNNSSLNVSQIRRKLFSEEEDLFDDLPSAVNVRRSSSFELDQRSSSPSQKRQENVFLRAGKPLTPDCSPIPLQPSRTESFSSTPQAERFDRIRRSSIDEDFSLIERCSFVCANEFSSDASKLMPSDYARKVLDNAMAELLECSL